MTLEKLKRIVIKEELVELTGDFKSAIILNQFLYWGERTKDYDKFIEEENKRSKEHQTELTHGWIYKTAVELSEETMLGMSSATIGRILKPLIEQDWIQQRTNPLYKWDQTLQYRVNILKIQEDLEELGYPLEGYKTRNFQNEKWNFQNEKAIPESTNRESFNIIINNNITIAYTMSELNEKLNALDKKKLDFYTLNEELFLHLLKSEEKVLNTDKVSTSDPLGALLWLALLDKSKRKVELDLTVNSKSFVKVVVRLIRAFKRLPEPLELNYITELLEGEYTPLQVIRGMELGIEKQNITAFSPTVLPYIADVLEKEQQNKTAIAQQKYQEKHPQGFQKPKPKSDFREVDDYEAF